MRELKRGRVRVLVDIVREPSTLPESLSGRLTGSRCAANLFRAFRASVPLPESKEAFLCACLDAKHKPIGIETVSIGSLQGSIVHPREVFRPAVILAAAAIVICHNHPSGDPKPSYEDESVTDRLKEAGRILGIPLLDHIILGDDRYWSTAEERYSSY